MGSPSPYHIAYPKIDSMGAYLDNLGMRIDLKGSGLDLLLLSALKAGPAHAYEILTLLNSRSQGLFDLAQGTVYPALHRLEKSGMLASTWESEAGRKRRIYSLTPRGRSELKRHLTEWKEWSQFVDRAVGGSHWRDPKLVRRDWL